MKPSKTSKFLSTLAALAVGANIASAATEAVLSFGGTNLQSLTSYGLPEGARINATAEINRGGITASKYLYAQTDTTTIYESSIYMPNSTISVEATDPTATNRFSDVTRKYSGTGVYLNQTYFIESGSNYCHIYLNSSNGAVQITQGYVPVSTNYNCTDSAAALEALCHAPAKSGTIVLSRPDGPTDMHGVFTNTTAKPVVSLQTAGANALYRWPIYLPHGSNSIFQVSSQLGQWDRPTNSVKTTSDGNYRFVSIPKQGQQFGRLVLGE